MPIVTVIFGDLLILLGALGYFLAEHRSLTALIPAAFGVVLNLLGGAALLLGGRKHLMHAALAMALLGLLGTWPMALPKLFALLGGGAVEREFAVVMQSIMGGLCLIYLGFGVQSFIAARRQAAQASSD